MPDPNTKLADGRLAAPQVAGGEEPSGRRLGAGVGHPGARIGQLPVDEYLDASQQVGVHGARHVDHASSV